MRGVFAFPKKEIVPEHLVCHSNDSQDATFACHGQVEPVLDRLPFGAASRYGDQLQVIRLARRNGTFHGCLFLVKMEMLACV